MRTTRNYLWVVCLSATLWALGCAGSGTAGSGTTRAVGPNDLPSLAGKWVGNVVPPGAKAQPGTLELAPDGSYVARAGAFSAQGTAQVKDGNLVLTSTSTTGGMATGQRTSTASLAQRPDGTLVLTGRGHSDTGPFDFTVTRPK